MPLSRHQVQPELDRAPPARLVALLRTAASEAERRAAALDLAGVPEAAPSLAAALPEAPPRVREAIMTALVAIATPEAAAGLAHCLASEDVALRNAAILALRQIGPAAGETLRPLLEAPDHDQRLFAIQALHACRHPQARAWLVGVLRREREVNVGLAAVEALAQCGGPDCVPDLHAFAARFAHEPFVAFAVALACRYARGAGGAAARQTKKHASPRRPILHGSTSRRAGTSPGGAE